ncbi:PREDICTED: uncharacterized protein LOC109592876 [Amphimedon queenslandica]|uniref:HTH CENPB-type domain-containing protein n=1 Tax=Amphimedon queenslandica TaxID=400682 RepID=A0A1X7SIZ8_AMPQE|nr:PREDICTED: uncharacterized protein LOC109592876 [Amphimedon queenslandica]|eukprot:XP_019863760.1 PREDICTED: uncharacterized protein LOC109592876 [Amphimedon queenslandica]
MSTKPIKDRVIISHFLLPPKSSSDTLKTCAVGRPSKYKHYDDDSLYEAYKEVVSKGVSIRRAALEYGVPASTLTDRVSGRIAFGKKSGPKKYLTDEEEKELVYFVSGCAEVGYSCSRTDVILLVQEVLYRKGIRDTVVSHGWWESFKRRHPEITLRKPEPLSHARLAGSHPDVLSRYFEELESTLRDNDIIDSPSVIFNIDESGFPLDPKSPLI